jgi:hypothetical protein
MAGPLAKAENPRRKVDVFHLQAGFDRAVAEDDVEELQEVAANIVFRIGDRRQIACPTCRALLQHFQPAEDLVFDIAFRHRVPGNFDGLFQCDVEGTGFRLRRIASTDEIRNGKARGH